MQSETTLATLLPRSHPKTLLPATLARPATLHFNLYPISLKTKHTLIYQYALSVEPELPKNSTALRERIIRQVYQDLKTHLQCLCYKAEMLWGRKHHPKTLSLIAQFLRDGTPFRFDVLIKPVKEIRLEDFLIENPDNLAAICQVLNINVSNVLKGQKMIELKRGSYFSPAAMGENVCHVGGLSVWKGTKFSVAAYNCKFYLQADVSSRVLSDEPFLATLDRDRNNLNHAQINQKYRGAKVLMRFGCVKEYTVEGVDWTLSPKSTFLCGLEGKPTTYIDYFKTKYGLSIKIMGQPLLRVSNRMTAIMKQTRPQQTTYLLPELVTLTGLREEQRSNYKIMKGVNEFTKISVNQSLREIEGYLRELKKSKELMFSIEQDLEAGPGYVMLEPRVSICGNKRVALKNGSIPLREGIKQPHKFTNLVFCYSIGKRIEQDQADADFAVDQLQSVAKDLNIALSKINWVEVEGHKAEDWITELQTYHQSETKKNSKFKFQLILFFLKDSESHLYPSLKLHATSTLDCASQVVMRKKLSDSQKGVLSCATKIVLQMNAKMGCTLWTIPNFSDYWTNPTRKVAMAGLASSKGKGGNMLGFVGTLNNDFSLTCSDCKRIVSKQTLTPALFKGFFTEWIQHYYFRNDKKLPTDLVIYREGLNDTQAKKTLEMEIDGLKEMLNTVRNKTNSPKYEPRIAYLLVNTKPQSKMFERQGKGEKSSYVNPEPGSVTFQPLARDGSREFHLASVEIREGRCSPVCYRIGYENWEHELGLLAELTYNQCYAYFNWPGAVRVPAVLQNANKLVKQYSEVGSELVLGQGSQLKMKPYFL